VINPLVNPRYETLERVGESALFTVYKARDKNTSRVVAIKMLQPPYDGDPVFVEALRAGLTASAALNHPNIATFYELGEENGVPYAVTEFVRGINLKERIRRVAPFALSIAIDFACAIAEALRYAHGIGQAHGDLRPHNVIISPEGAVKVINFGVQPAVARSVQAQHETLRRSAPYHAPELSTTQSGTAVGDIYALGAILYEMLTGAPPYAGDTPEAVADQHAFADIPSPQVANPGVPRSVEGIILKCLQKQPGVRYPSAAELLNDLKAVRDALRFGKSLSWSPIDLDKATVASPAPAVAAATAPVARPAAESPAPRPRVPEPVAEAPAARQSIAMPTQTRSRPRNEGVSIFIKIAMGAVTFVIIVCLIALAGIWSSNWVVPSPQAVPQLVGKTYDQVQQIAASMKLRIIPHPTYTDKPRGLVYKTDLDPGTPIHPNHYVNIWYSKGPEYVSVPDVTRLSQDAAEQKLKEAGLIVGRVDTRYDSKVPEDAVISQSISHKKRVFHDTPVDLVTSLGPKPDYADTNGDTSNPNSPDQTNNTGQDNGAGNPTIGNDTGNGDNNTANATTNPGQNTDNTNADDQPEHEFNRTISIPNDGRGIRRVRIEYTDAKSPSPILAIDEDHDAGDKIPVSFLYYGKKISLSIYYDNQLVWHRTFDPQATRHQRIQ